MKRLITTQRVGDLHTIEVYRSPYSGYEVIITGDRIGYRNGLNVYHVVEVEDMQDLIQDVCQEPRFVLRCFGGCGQPVTELCLCEYQTKAVV